MDYFQFDDLRYCQLCPPDKRGYCSQRKEYQSDDGYVDGGIIWQYDLALCERCGSVIKK